MAMRHETVLLRVMIQANWRVGQRLLANLLAIRWAACSQAYSDRGQARLTRHMPWRLNIMDEMGTVQMPSDGETQRILLGNMACENREAEIGERWDRETGESGTD
jgi:hypothetical protein